MSEVKTNQLWRKIKVICDEEFDASIENDRKFIKQQEEEEEGAVVAAAAAYAAAKDETAKEEDSGKKGELLKKEQELKAALKEAQKRKKEKRKQVLIDNPDIADRMGDWGAASEKCREIIRLIEIKEKILDKLWDVNVLINEKDITKKSHEKDITKEGQHIDMGEDDIIDNWEYVSPGYPSKEYNTWFLERPLEDGDWGEANFETYPCLKIINDTVVWHEYDIPIRIGNPLATTTLEDIDTVRYKKDSKKLNPIPLVWETISRKLVIKPEEFFAKAKYIGTDEYKKKHAEQKQNGGVCLVEIEPSQIWRKKILQTMSLADINKEDSAFPKYVIEIIKIDEYGMCTVHFPLKNPNIQSGLGNSQAGYEENILTLQKIQEEYDYVSPTYPCAENNFWFLDMDKTWWFYDIISPKLNNKALRKQTPFIPLLFKKWSFKERENCELVKKDSSATAGTMEWTCFDMSGEPRVTPSAIVLRALLVKGEWFEKNKWEEKLIKKGITRKQISIIKKDVEEGNNTKKEEKNATPSLPALLDEDYQLKLNLKF